MTFTAKCVRVIPRYDGKQGKVAEDVMLSHETAKDSAASIVIRATGDSMGYKEGEEYLVSINPSNDASDKPNDPEPKPAPQEDVQPAPLDDNVFIEGSSN